MARLPYYLVHGIGGYAGAAIGFGLLIAVATGIWLKARQAPITRDVTHESKADLTGGYRRQRHDSVVGPADRRAGSGGHPVSAWFNYAAAIKILVFGLVIGAGLPALFAMGVRINAEGAGVARHGDAVAQRNPLVLAVSWLIFAVVLVAVTVGVLFIARDFVGHHTGWYILGAKQT